MTSCKIAHSRLHVPRQLFSSSGKQRITQPAVQDNDCVMADAFTLDAAAALASVATAAGDSIPSQKRGWRHVTLCYSASLCSFDVLLCVAFDVAGENLVIDRDYSQPGANGLWRCKPCDHRIAGKQPSRPREGGRAHIVCIMRASRTVTPASSPAPRTKRPYESLKPTQRWVRRTRARAAVGRCSRRSAALSQQSFNLPPALLQR